MGAAKMTDSREKMFDKIRALLSKTTAAGCTEEEALTALAKARALMDAYEITDADLQLAKEVGVGLRKDSGKDPHNIKWAMTGRLLIFAIAGLGVNGEARLCSLGWRVTHNSQHGCWIIWPDLC
jgi:hypothetical protein